MAKKVLIIEDSEDIGGALKMLIEYEGYEVFLASTALHGREMARSLLPDLMIVDLMLPDGDGIELTRQLRATPAAINTPIICVSSYTQGLEKLVLEAGCDELFSKTTFIENFHQTLGKYLGNDNGY